MAPLTPIQLAMKLLLLTLVAALGVGAGVALDTVLLRRAAKIDETTRPTPH